MRCPCDPSLKLLAKGSLSRLGMDSVCLQLASDVDVIYSL